MTSWGDRLMTTARPRLAQGVAVRPEDVTVAEPISYSSFVGGLNLADGPEDTPPNAAVYAVDMDVSRADELVRAPGITTIQTQTTRVLLNLFNHPTLDYTAELVAIDAPWLGYSPVGDYTSLTWANAAIAGVGGGSGARWNGRAIGGLLIFSDGTAKVYTRAAAAATVTDVSAQLKAADTFASFAGRTYAGAITPAGGTYQGLGIAWSGSSGTISDFTGTNSGAELLVQDSKDADKIISLNSIGFDVMGILCRRSLWAAYKTGVASRPADFRPRFQSIGCVSRETAQLTPGGITFLSDEGVMNYDINSVTMISRAINGSLLPLDTGQLQNYRAAYHPVRQRYYLMTPTELWVYTFPTPETPGYWTKRGVLLGNIIAYGVLTGSPFGAASQMGFVDDAVLGYLRLGREDPTSTQYFEAPLFTPTWRTSSALKGETTQQVTTLGFEIEYTSTATADIQLRTMDSQGLWTGSTPVSKTLLSTGGLLKRVKIQYIWTGMNTGIEIAITNGFPKIARITQLVQAAGPSLRSV